MGLATFGHPDVFAKFVARCQEFVEKTSRPKNVMDWLIEQGAQSRYPIPDAFLDAFRDEDCSSEW